jgi:hypothetical protein
VAVAAIVAAIALIAAVVAATRPRSSARDELNNAQTDNTTSAAPIPVPTLPSERFMPLQEDSNIETWMTLKLACRLLPKIKGMLL